VGTRNAKTDDASEPRRPVGRPPKLGEAELDVLKALALDNPSATVGDLVRLLHEQTGVKVSDMTLYKGLRKAGVQRVKPDPTRSAPAEASGGGESTPKRYGYTVAHRDAGDAERYPCSLTDYEWELVADIFENDGGRGKPAKYPRRRVVDACCYVLRSGCSWRMLPKEFPPWHLVYKTFRRWVAKSKFEQMHDRLRAAWREREQRNVQPSAGVMDSQSVRTSAQGGPKGFDAGKKVKGRKRHLVVDTLGLMLAVVISPASVQDRDGAPSVVKAALDKYPSLKKVFVDGGYAGKCAQQLRDDFDIEVEVVRRANPAAGRWHDSQLRLPIEIKVPADKGFVVLPKRWVVERTNAWNDNPRRMAKDHDRRLDVSEAWVWLTEARLLARRLATAAAPVAEAA